MKNIIFLLSASLLIYLSACSTKDPEPASSLSVANFSVTLNERPANNDLLGIIEASSKSGSLTYSLVNQSPANSISIDASTGEITVNDQSLFDINTVGSVTAQVKVTDGKSTKNTSVDISLELPAATISYLKEVALGFEFGSASQITRKWMTNMKIFVGGAPTTELLTELDDIIADINGLTSGNFNISIVTDTLQSNYYLYFGSGSSYASIFPNQASLVTSNWGLFSIFWNGNNELTTGYMYVDLFRPNALEQRHLLREELTQSLGLARDSELYEDSIFQQAWTRVTEFSELDKELIYLLYHSDMTTGLNASQTDTKLRQILKDDW